MFTFRGFNRPCKSPAVKQQEAGCGWPLRAGHTAPESSRVPQKIKDALASFVSPVGDNEACFYFNSATFELRVTKPEVST